MKIKANRIYFLWFWLSPMLFACGLENTFPSGKIAYTSNKTGNHEIYILDVKSGEEKQVTKTEHDLNYHPTFTNKDHEVIFYNSHHGYKSIWIADTSGDISYSKSPGSINYSSPIISPNEDFIIFSSDHLLNQYNIYRLWSATDSIEPITANEFYEESPSLSPDGKTLAFTRQIRDENDTSHAANGEIFLMDLATKKESRLTIKEGYDSGADWSPDGKKIAFYGEANGSFDLFTIAIDGTQLLNVTKDSLEQYSPSWDKSGNWLAYTSGDHQNYDISIINIKSGKRKRLTSAAGRDEDPDWFTPKK